MKTRLLFVISHLGQGGSERYTYELLKAIDRDRFDVALLTKRRRRKLDYYDDLITQLGVPIYRRLPIFLGYLRGHARPTFLLFRAPLEILHRLTSAFLLRGLLDDYDVINAVQIENYYLLQPLVRDNDRIVVHLMSNAFQYKVNPYDDCRPGRRYLFTIFDRRMPEDWANAPCKSAETIYFPLSMDLRGRPALTDGARLLPPYHIGVFIRLSPERALTGIFRAFELFRREVDAELWLYGRGDPAIFDKEIDALGIREGVRFKGHAASIADTIAHGGLSFVWMTCFGTTLGYASIEVASLGFPMMLLNLAEMTHAEASTESGGALHAYPDPTALATATLDALRDPIAFQDSGRRLREWTMRTFDMSRYIRGLEERLEDIAARTRR